MDPELIRKEMARRRTFAIISHPDAGKTTLTEKLLLYGGAIQLAGSVRARRNQRTTSSDWMELEQQRGISISSTLLQFEYRDHVVNLLDTPGHKDFSEDTYRVLTAVDSVVMVMDAAKGVEERTRKLFEICRLRGIPIFTFYNKMDRPSRDPLALLDELENVLGIGAFPVTWPLGSGTDFRGVYDRLSKELYLYEHTARGQRQAPFRVAALRDEALRRQMSDPAAYEAWVEELDMLSGAGETFDERRVLAGEITPVFFGSAVSNFGVQHLLDTFLQHGAPPQPRRSTAGPVDPASSEFSGFVFKVQANMNPRHRDCLSFVRVCSGVFERDMTVLDSRTGKPIRLSYAQKLFGQDRESLDIAFPGDIVGLVTHKPFRIGETLTANPEIRYDEIPRFPPEAFAYIRPAGTAKNKQFRDGLAQLLEEGIIQSFRFTESDPSALLGAVGQLQFDVVVFRLREEYGAEPRLEPAPFTSIRWLDSAVPPAELVDLFLGSGVRLAWDMRGHPVLLFPSEWAIRYFMEKYPKLLLHTVSPHAPGFPAPGKK